MVMVKVFKMFDDSNFWNIQDDLKGRPLNELQDIQKARSLPYAVAAINVTGDLNMGIMMRTACIMGASDFFIFGRRKYDKRSAVGAQNYINLHRVAAVDDDGNVDYDVVLDTIKQNWTPVFVEQGGRDVRDMAWPDKPCIIMGNEATGIPIEICSQYDMVSIRQRGIMRSLNVSTACGIICDHLRYELS